MSSGFTNPYSSVEKSLHNLAFKTGSAQISLSDLESRLNKKKLAQIQIEKPVFITALPRAGTTLLLELCYQAEEFVSHTYRDMPFLMTPLFWNRFSKLFKKEDTARERAHGDGMMIDADSPEAFEEIIWKAFWPSRYKEDQILPWSEARYQTFETFLKEHIQKIILLKKKTESARYISKNNLNIARIPYLKTIFPDAIIVVPFRDPLQHAQSLLRQHHNFLKMHADDAFSKKYMKDIGHFDFGQNLKPVNFNDWLTKEKIFEKTDLSFWLQYWFHAYTHLLETLPTDVRFFCYEDFCNNPKPNLEIFANHLKMQKSETLTNTNRKISLPRPYDIDTTKLPADLLSQTQDLYSKLRTKSLSA